MKSHQFKNDIILNKVAFDLNETKIVYYIIENIRPHTRVDLLDRVVAQASFRHMNKESIVNLINSAWKLL